MSLPTRVTRSLVDPFESMSRDVDTLMRTFFGRGDSTTGYAPYAVDVWEDVDHLHVEAELPGFAKENVDVTIDNNVLTITAERTEQTPPDAENGKRNDYLLRERRYNRFQRSFTLPNTIDSGSVEAKLDNGVLHLTLNKRQETKPRKVAIG
ncbi:MAG: Hsp20/alpha crystallin family protein [Tepidisphaeraceae bacterium]